MVNQLASPDPGRQVIGNPGDQTYLAGIPVRHAQHDDPRAQLVFQLIKHTAQFLAGTRVLATELEGVSGKELRGMLDQLKNKLGSGVIVLGVADRDAGKVSVIAGVTDDLTSRVKAGELVNHVASQVGGKGGGRADMAQAGGTDVVALAAALESVTGWVEARLQ